MVPSVQIEGVLVKVCWCSGVYSGIHTGSRCTWGPSYSPNFHSKSRLSVPRLSRWLPKHIICSTSPLCPTYTPLLHKSRIHDGFKRNRILCHGIPYSIRCGPISVTSEQSLPPLARPEGIPLFNPAAEQIRPSMYASDLGASHRYAASVAKAPHNHGDSP